MKTYPPCESCGRAMSSSNRPVPAGMVRYGGHGLCDTCAHRRRREVVPHVVAPLPTPDTFDSRPWVEQAACAEVDGDLWFPEVGSNGSRAKAICAGCQARTDCLAWAVTNEEPFGIWGGLAPRERFRLRRRGAA